MSDHEPPKRRWKGKPPKGGGERQLSTRVKNKKLDESSRNWVRRQLNDPYVARARGDGYRARAAYKLLELDEQFHFLKRGQRVIDQPLERGGTRRRALDSPRRAASTLRHARQCSGARSPAGDPTIAG